MAVRSAQAQDCCRRFRLFSGEFGSKVGPAALLYAIHHCVTSVFRPASIEALPIKESKYSICRTSASVLSLSTKGARVGYDVIFPTQSTPVCRHQSMGR